MFLSVFLFLCFISVYYCFHVFIMLENNTEWVLADAIVICTQQVTNSDEKKTDCEVSE